MESAGRMFEVFREQAEANLVIEKWWHFYTMSARILRSAIERRLQPAARCAKNRPRKAKTNFGWLQKFKAGQLNFSD